MNFKENRPIYMQIADRIADEVLSGGAASRLANTFGARICGNSGGERQHGGAQLRLSAAKRRDL